MFSEREKCKIYEDIFANITVSVNNFAQFQISPTELCVVEMVQGPFEVSPPDKLNHPLPPDPAGVGHALKDLSSLDIGVTLGLGHWTGLTCCM